MSIRLTCEQCGARYAVPDASAGKRLRCKSCQAVLSVPEAFSVVTPAAPPSKRIAPARERPAAQPARRPDEHDDDDDHDSDRPRRGRSSKKKSRRRNSGIPGRVIAVGAIAAVVLLVGGVVTTILVTRSRPANGQAFAPAPVFGGPGAPEVAGQEGPNTAQLREFIAIMEQLTGTVSQIRDQASLANAQTMVRDTNQKLRDMRTRILANPRMTPAERQRFFEIEQQSQPKVQAMINSVSDFRGRSGQIKVDRNAAQEFDRSWNEMTNSIQSLDRAFESKR